MARFKSVNDIVNQVAIETGIAKTKIADVFGSTNVAYTQLTGLCDACGVELMETEAWNKIRRVNEFTTVGTDSGIYELPTDFGYMIDQTGWERSENVPLFGPLSPQEWAYLRGRDFASSTIYASFRLAEGQFWLYPYAADATLDVPAGLEISYEYVARVWVLVDGMGSTFADLVASAADLILYEPFLFERLLKARFLEARGFDNAAAMKQYETALQIWEGKDKSAVILNAARGSWNYPYLDIMRNTSDTGFGT